MMQPVGLAGPQDVQVATVLWEMAAAGARSSIAGSYVRFQERPHESSVIILPLTPLFSKRELSCVIPSSLGHIGNGPHCLYTLKTLGADAEYGSHYFNGVNPP